MEVVQLQPGDLLHDGRYQSGAEGRLYATTLDHMRSTLSYLVADDEFVPGDVPMQLHDDLAHTGLDTLVTESIREELKWSYVGTKVLEAYGFSKPDDGYYHRDDEAWQGPIHAPMPAAFGQDLLRQVANLQTDFSEVARMHESFSRTGLLGLIQNIQSLGLGTPDQIPDAAGDAFEWVREAMYNPYYTLSLKEDDALFLLCYMPYRTRRLIKDALIANQVMARMDDVLGEELTRDEAEMRTALRQLLYADALTGQTWDEAAHDYGMPVETAREKALLSGHALEAQAAIQRLRDSSRGQRVLGAYESAMRIMQERIEQAYRRDGAHLFTNTDIGHGFKGFNSYAALAVLNNTAQPELTHNVKDGSRAIIFEDDEDQARMWAKMVDRYSPHEAEIPASYIDFDYCAEAASDPDARLFLIDIENAEGETAGIELAEQVLRTKLDYYFGPGQGEWDKPTSIIVWSNSPAQLMKANDYFYRLVAGNDQERLPGAGHLNYHFVRGGGKSGGRAPISFSVKPKDLSYRDLTDYRAR